MPPQDDKPSWLDKLAKTLAVPGFLLAVLSLIWQIYTYRESHEENVAATIVPFRTFSKKGWDPKGKVTIEIVNTGSSPLYLKRVMIHVETDQWEVSASGDEASRRIFVFYDAGATKGNESTKLLQPSQSAKYSQDWDFSEHPLIKWHFPGDAAPPVAGRDEDITVEVWTTKKGFSLPHSIVLGSMTRR